jgi:hypothetical protein
MPKSYPLDNEDRAKDHIEMLMSSDEAQDFFGDGLKMGLTVVEIDDIDADEDHKFVRTSIFNTASEIVQWEAMIHLCRTCSATWRSKTRTLYCMRYGPKHVAAIDFVKEDSRLGVLHQRFINAFQMDMVPLKPAVGEPTVSVGGVSYKEMHRVDWPGMLDVAQSRVRQAKELGKNKIVNAPDKKAITWDY